jgi:hypothetical protein
VSLSELETMVRSALADIVEAAEEVRPVSALTGA